MDLPYVLPTRLKDYLKGVLAENLARPLPSVAVDPPPVPAVAGGNVLASKTMFAPRTFSMPPVDFLPRGNFSKAPEENVFDLSRPFEKPMSIGPPPTFREAKLSPWWPQYKGAMDVEYGGLTENRTYDVVKRISMPRGTNLIRGKWIFSDKRGEDGKIIKFKARWVACGYSQVPGVDFKETFAGVVVAKSFRIMLVILNEDAQNEMEHWDVKMAFTVAPLEETLYMVEPEGYERVLKGENVCLLKRSLYGLKQSARNWQLLLETYFLQNGFSRSKADACFFFLCCFF